jgi:hypothetical protein
MIMLVLFGNLLAIFFKEWKGCRRDTRVMVGIGILILGASIVSLTWGNYLEVLK